MEWRDEAVILGIRRHGETSVVAELMTKTRGRHTGLVRGGRSRRLQPVLQPGNLVEATWRARLDEHMGTLVVEPLRLHAVQLLASHLRLLAEREPHRRLYGAMDAVLEGPQDAAAYGSLVLAFEIAVLDELGFGLDLSCCALTGAREGLAYVSPRTGRAVTAEAGAPWADRLLALPALLFGVPRGGTADELQAGFALTRHFFARHLWEPRNLAEPAPRRAVLAELSRRLSPRRPLEDGGKTL